MTQWMARRRNGGGRAANGARRIVGLLVVALVAACRSASLYDWNGYEESVEAVCHDFKDGDPPTHLQGFAERVAKGEAAGRRAPPGVHAHLAYLYTLVGDASSADRELLREKELFPESAVFVDRLRAKVHP